jgi:hypothetical protein
MTEFVKVGALEAVERDAGDTGALCRSRAASTHKGGEEVPCETKLEIGVNRRAV